MEKIVKTLVSQHNELRVLLRQIEEDALRSKDGDSLVEAHGTFLKKLEEHLLLEDECFYPKILEGMKQKNVSSEQIDKTKMFIKKMKDIEVEVIRFFDAYKTSEAIRESKDSYLRELKDIMATLIMRIEAEEDGVYIMWDFFGVKG